uniref:Uncharacterized protein n=2 Tax=Timema TaxID=61471 RepID=A0A7R9FJK0_9NEOP|nr:unnamed protein product [Timema bartmani]CAD7454401.1 unnamed protein product [Timema tahoe]
MKSDLMLRCGTPFISLGHRSCLLRLGPLPVVETSNEPLVKSDIHSVNWKHCLHKDPVSKRLGTVINEFD